jgi:hypothetical protein
VKPIGLLKFTMSLLWLNPSNAQDQRRAAFSGINEKSYSRPLHLDVGGQKPN